MRRMHVRVSAVCLTAILATMWAATPAPAASGPVGLTLHAPSSLRGGSPLHVTGSATVQGIGAPSLAIEIRSGEATSASVTTDTAGNYSATFTPPVGTHVFTAVAFRGRAQMESVSDPVTVAVRAGAGGPPVEISSYPPSATNATSASFTFTTEPAATTRCSLDGSAFTPCTSPKAYSSLADGTHTFSVRATDAYGEIGPVESHSWLIDTVAPSVTISSAPSSPTKQTSATFAFSSDAGASMVCALDGGAFAPCTSPKTYTGLTAVSHTFSVRATDPSGNTGPVASHVWVVDTAPPDTSITVGPSGTAASGSATFAFTATESSSFECTLDGGAPASCVSPVSHAGLPDGAHTFTVRATDAAGNIDATPASRSWTIDTTGPTATITSAPASPTKSVSASFSFTAEAGATFGCSLDGSAFTICTSPRSITSLGDGSHVFTVRATDAAGNTGATATHAWTVDTSAPTVQISGAPVSPTNQSSATFVYSSEPGAATTCSLDGAAFAACTSPASYSGLAPGSHTFAVRATDTATNTGPNATHAWTIDATAPDTSITAGPSGVLTSSSATFSFSATEASSFACALDGGAYDPCTSPRTYASLADGAHTFTVRATDGAGNVDATPASRTWSVDSAGPAATLTATPQALSSSTSASFSFTAEAGATFACSLDDAAFTACTSPKSYSGLADGTHGFEVRASDGTGNTGAVTAHAWTVDTAAPVTSISSAPASPTNQTSATFAFSSEPGAALTCSLDGAAFTSCTSPRSYASLTAGSHTVAIRATDAAGNTGPSASHTWTVDTTAPDTSISGGPTGTATSSSATFAFTATETASFVCTLDGGAATACTSPVSYSGLADAAHTFTVRATDAAGNADASPAARTWTVDTDGGSVTITSAPASPTTATSASFSFASEAGATYACSLDGSAFASCTSPRSYSSLADGSHTFVVRATDAGGTTGPAASHSWTIDATAPVAVVDTRPASPTSATSQTIAFSTEAGASLECALDGAGFSACTSPQSLTSLADGTHTFAVRARDAAGNVDSTPDSVSWVVDTAVAAASVAATPAGPANDNTPYISGAAEPRSTVRAYRSPTCNGSPVAQGDAAAYRAGFTVAVTDDTSNALSVRVTDAAGNTSSCSTLTYIEDSTAPGFTGDVRALGSSVSSLMVHWPAATDAVSAAALTYEVCVSTTATCGTTFVVAASGVGDARLERVGSLAPRTRYEVLVRVRDEAGNRTVGVPVTGETLGGGVVASVDAGEHHSCVVLVDQVSRCWGMNWYGQVGDGTTTERSAPVTVPGLVRPTQVSAGGNHTCALLLDTTVRCWGRNDTGQLGDGTLTGRSSPVAVLGLSGAVKITAGGSHTCALLSDTSVRCWGGNLRGELGDGTTTDSMTPVEVTGLYGAADVSAGSRHTCASLWDGTTWCWGGNSSGQVGDSTTTNRSVPTWVYGIPMVTQISAGGEFTCALLFDGSARCWGANESGQVGDGTTTMRSSPTVVSGLTDATAISAGTAHACARRWSGEVRCWGMNNVRQLGDGTSTNRPLPVAAAGIVRATSVSAGRYHTCALREDASVSCWGYNIGGELGDGTNIARTNPVVVVGLAAAVQLDAESGHSCVLLADGTARCWGSNSFGQLGDGTTTDRPTPVRVSGLSGATQISVGPGHACAVISGGTVKCWGSNDGGQLGDGTTTQRTTPVTVTGIATATQVAVGQHHTCVALTDGTARCWGRNWYGQLGEGTTLARTGPVTVLDLTGIQDLSAGWDQTCAVVTGGTTWCWGHGTWGQLGDGTSSNRSRPVQTYRFTGAIDVEAGGMHTCAIRRDATAWCWGRNWEGQVGSSDLPIDPVLVQDLTGVVGLGAGSVHTCAVVSDGTARCWGENGSGQLGDGTIDQRGRPITVIGLSGAAGIDGGSDHTCALIRTGTGSCWGANGLGELGNGTTSTAQKVPGQPRTYS